MTRNLRLALYQPDIAGNTGTILRMAACLGLGVDIIEPAGFDMSDRALKRAGMDYLEIASLTRHVDFAAFDAWRKGEARRLLLFSTKAAEPYTAFAFSPNDILLFGRESAGVRDVVHRGADARLLIPQVAGRSLNLAVSAAMAAGEAVRWRPALHYGSGHSSFEKPIQRLFVCFANHSSSLQFANRKTP